MLDPLNPYKLIVLYMLSRVDFPLTRVQLFDFILDRGYTTYFVLQQAIGELIDAGLVRSKSFQDSTQLSMTEEGNTTLSYFENRIDKSIRDEVCLYFEEQKLQMKDDLSVKAQYYKSTSGDYIAELSISGGKETPIEISISAPTEKSASDICKSWKSRSQGIYAYLMRELL